jgi:hypothetical protein
MQATLGSRAVGLDEQRSRRFYVGVGLWCLGLALVGFAPSVYDYITGAYFFPIAVHFHGAIMIAWIGLYTFQASLIARGNPTLHRRVGRVAVTWAAAVWLSMAVATVVSLCRFDPAQMGFLVQPLLIQLASSSCSRCSWPGRWPGAIGRSGTSAS